MREKGIKARGIKVVGGKRVNEGEGRELRGEADERDSVNGRWNLEFERFREGWRRGIGWHERPC